MATIAKTLTDLAAKAGITLDSVLIEKLKTVRVELSDDVVNTLTTNLLNLDGAKQSPELKKHFTATVLNGADAAMESLFEELGFDADAVSELKGIKSTYERIPALARKVKALEEAKSALNENNSKAVLQKEIDRLNGEVEVIKKAGELEIANIKKQAAGEKLTLLADHELSSFAFPKDTREDSLYLAKYHLANELKAKGAMVVLGDDGQLKLVQATNPDQPYTENKHTVSYKDFATKVVANKKLLEVTDPNAAGKNGDEKNIIQPTGSKDIPAVLSQAANSMAAGAKALASVD